MCVQLTRMVRNYDADQPRDEKGRWAETEYQAKGTKDIVEISSEENESRLFYDLKMKKPYFFGKVGESMGGAIVDLRKDNTAYLNRIDAFSKGQGYGGYMMRRIMHDLKEKGTTHVTAYVERGNAASEALLKKHGFAMTEEKKEGNIWTRTFPKKPTTNARRKSRNPMRVDPSRTVLLRREFTRDLNRRLRALVAAAREWCETNLDPIEVVTANAPKKKRRKPFVFETDQAKVTRFNRWLKKQVDDGLLESNPTTGEPRNGKPWTRKYVDSSYRKGAVRAYTSARPKLAKTPGPVYAGTQQGFLESAFARPERVDKLRLLYTRSYENLKGVTSQMSAQLSRTLADGVAHGKGAPEIGRQISKDVKKISRTRANVLARTEVMHAHAEGQLDALSDLGIDEVEAEVEFTTSDDDAVCPQCEKLSGQVYTVDEARGVIPVHPNCRCSWIPAITPPKKKGKKR